MKFIVASTIARFVTKVKSGWPYSNKSHSSFEERRIRSVLVKLETWSRSFLRCIVKWGSSVQEIVFVVFDASQTPAGRI